MASSMGLRLLPLLLLLLQLLTFRSVVCDFPESEDVGGEAGDDEEEAAAAAWAAAAARRSGGGGSGGGESSAELAGEAALGGLRRRLELDGALDAAVRAGHAAAEQLRRQAAEIAELRSENSELRAAVASGASAVSAAASALAKRSSGIVAPPAGVDAERDRDLAQLAGLLAHPGRAGAAAATAGSPDSGDEESEAAGAGCFPAGTPLAECAQVRRRFGLAMDAEAAALCDSHRLCAACAGSYSVPASACDRAYVTVAAGLCLKESDPVRCGRQADALLAAMRAAHAPADSVAAGIIGCHRPCAARLLATVRPSGN